MCTHDDILKEVVNKCTKHLLKSEKNCTFAMKLSQYIYVTLPVLSLVTLGSGFEPVTMAISGIVGVGSLFAVSLLEPIRCRVLPCCNSRWITTNVTGLKLYLRHNLHGQHLAKLIIPQQIESHVQSENPPKALVLSLHGPVGVGKTFVSKGIAENIYQGGLESRFVHLISAMRDFPHGDKLSIYQSQLQAWIEGNVTECDRSLFIFEEVDKLPAGLLDVLVPFVEYGSHHHHIKYNKAIFILLSNTGSSNIERATFDHWKSGKSRETLGHLELKHAITQAIIEDTEYGLSQSQLMSKNLVSAFVPFLPLEKEHVTKCIGDVIQAEALSSVCPQGRVPAEISTDKQKPGCIPYQELVNKVMKRLIFSPKEEPIFSDSGCKRIQNIYEFTNIDEDL